MRAADSDLSQVPDDELVQAIRMGDEAALTSLYRRYVHAIFRFIMAQVRDADDAEDLTSETFARMLNGIGQFRGEASFKNWLYQIARNAVRNHRRAAGYRRTVPLPASLALAEPEGGPGGGEAARQVDLKATLGLLGPLPPRYRQVLELRFLAGLSIEETAERMGVTSANAKVLQHRALKKAAAIMQEQPVESQGAAR
jgi:RNA polymerase sigma-70 factor (ECF subfamily)